VPKNSLTDVLAAISILSHRSPRIGRTHIHKFLYLAEAWRILPATHTFTLYLHGPYSHDLDASLQALQAAGIVKAIPDAGGYGARYSLAAGFDKYPPTDWVDPPVLAKLELLASEIASKGVRELEAMATAELVRRRDESAEPDLIVGVVKALKPHLSQSEIEASLTKVTGLRESVASQV
jgi:uncharacterized protein YwgA